MLMHNIITTIGDIVCLMIIISGINSAPFYYLVNLDQQKVEDSLSSASIPVQLIPKINYAISNQEIIKTTPLSIEQRKKTKCTLQEITAIIIDSLVFQDANGTALIPNQDYLVYPVLSGYIIPSNYYEGFIGNAQKEDEMKAVCTYFNSYPSYQLKKTFKGLFSSVINTQNNNFAINQGKLISFEYIAYLEDPIQVKSISIDSSGIADSTVKAQFDSLQTGSSSDGIVKLFLLDCYYDKRTMIAALRKDNSNKEAFIIYVMEVIESSSDVSLKAIAICNDHEEGEIAQIGLKKGYLFIAMKGANGGLSIFQKSGSKYGIIILKKDKTVTNILDILVNSKSVYVINDIGLHIFDIENLKYNQTKVIEHPHFKTLDYVLQSMNTTSPYFIGISVNNQPPLYPEILIELIANEDTEFNPKLNKVFVTSKDINIEDMITNKYYTKSYIFDRLTSKMYILTRGVPYIENTFSYVFDLTNDFTFTIGQNNYISMISLKGDENKPIIGITDDSNTVFFQEILMTPQTLECYFNFVGSYKEIFTIQKDCSKWSGEKFVYQSCLYKYVFNISVDPEGNTVGIWIGVTVCIAVIVGIIVFLFCCRKCWNKTEGFPIDKSQYQKGQTAVNDNPNMKHKEMKEFEMDNKL